METGIAGVRFVARYQLASCAAERRLGPMTPTPTPTSADATEPTEALGTASAAQARAATTNVRTSWVTARITAFIDGRGLPVEHGR
jgi:hypothetical protein